MRRLYWYLMIAGVAALLTMTACGSAGLPPVSIAEACAPEKDGKKATVNGYFQTDFMVFCTESCTARFCRDAWRGKPAVAGCQGRLGSEPNA